MGCFKKCWVVFLVRSLFVGDLSIKHLEVIELVSQFLVDRNCVESEVFFFVLTFIMLSRRSNHGCLVVFQVKAHFHRCCILCSIYWYLKHPYSDKKSQVHQSWEFQTLITFQIRGQICQIIYSSQRLVFENARERVDCCFWGFKRYEDYCVILYLVFPLCYSLHLARHPLSKVKHRTHVLLMHVAR